MYNFTLIIPTHNRHDYLKRSIEYFKVMDAKVIYCDSSEISYNGDFGSNMEYLHLPDRKFADKILVALNKITTDFVALCADDDFIHMESLYEGVNFLNNSTSFKTVLGNNISFHENFDGNFYKKNKTDLQLKDVNFYPEKNIILFFSNYQQILWGLYKKNILTESFELIKKANYNNDNFIELTIGAIACYIGGIKYLDKIWSIRELSSKEHWGHRHKPLTYFYHNKKIRSDFRVFRDLIDAKTETGFGNLVLKNFLKYNFGIFLNLSFKIFIIKIIPKCLYVWVKNRLISDTIHENMKVQIVNEKQQLSYLSSILSKY